jgi:hypothetical protein
VAALNKFESDSQDEIRRYADEGFKARNANEDICAPQNFAQEDKRYIYVQKRAVVAIAFAEACRSDPAQAKLLALYDLPRVLHHPSPPTIRHTCAVLGR